MIARCNLCPVYEEAFRVPWDEIGVELMKAHIEDKHPDQRGLPLPENDEVPGDYGWNPQTGETT